MAARRKPATTARAPSPPAEPPPPPRKLFRPPWYDPRYAAGVQHSTKSVCAIVRELEAGTFRLPVFQRPWKWTDGQIVELFDSLIHSIHVGSLLLWEQDRLAPGPERFGEVEVQPSHKPWTVLVVDGQQRLGAIATAALSGRFWFDLLAGQLTTEGPGPWRIEAGALLARGRVVMALDWYEPHAREHDLPATDVFDALLTMQDALDRAYISAVSIPSSWPLDRVMESYSRLATKGTPMDPAEVEEGLRRALAATA